MKIIFFKKVGGGTSQQVRVKYETSDKSADKHA